MRYLLPRQPLFVALSDFADVLLTFSVKLQYPLWDMNQLHRQSSSVKVLIVWQRQLIDSQTFSSRSRLDQFMFQSIPSKTVPRAKPWGMFWICEFPTTQEQRKCETRLLGQINCAKIPPTGNYLKKNAKKPHKTWDRNYGKELWHANTFNPSVTKGFRTTSDTGGGGGGVGPNSPW